MGDKKSEVLQGTLDLMVLKTLHSMGPLHGFGIARRIEQLSERIATERRHSLHIAFALTAARLDRLRMGHFGKQSQSAVLLDYPPG